MSRNSHRRLRDRDHLVQTVPKEGAVVCPECGNHCRLEDGEKGLCNLREAQDGKIVERFPGQAIVSWYFDPIPTNCVGSWICPCTEDVAVHGRYRLNNLAVFYGSCSSDCLFCQNSSYRGMMSKGEPLMAPRELASAANDKTACVCYFGGDPSCNPQHSVETSQLLMEERGIKVCYETGGIISSKWLTKIADVVEGSGGTIKIDLKALNPSLYEAMTGVSNESVLKNFRELARRGLQIDRPFLVASLLLVPGYVGVSEVRRLSKFIADCDPTIPTALLGFAPHHGMSDLPRTSRKHATEAQAAAVEAGLTNVRIGNLGLLSGAEYDTD
ncbi:MAG: radical SAM protein [Candidatus Thorarchaeota archaeon]